MSENLEELLARHFKENTRQILDTTREMIQGSRQEIIQETRQMIQESRQETLQETRDMIQGSRQETLQETRGLIQDLRVETREMIQGSERRMVVLLEEIRSDVRAIAEGLEMTQQRFELSRAEDRDDIDSLDRRVTRLEARAASAG